MTRIRSESTVHPNGLRKVTTVSSGSVAQSVVQFPALYSKTTTDAIVPNFHQRVQQGEIFNNPFAATSDYRTFDGIYHCTERAYANGVWSPKILYDMDRAICAYVPGYNTHNAYAAPTTGLGISGNKALAAVNATGFNAPLFISEWHKTKALIPQIGSLLIKTFRDGRKILRNGNIRHLPATSKNLANAWLLGRFGVTPLLYELQGACALLEKARPTRATARGNHSFSTVISSSSQMGDGPGTYTVLKDTKIEVVSRSGILYTGSDSNAGILAAVGLTRPATVAWELIPWSFVIDRFVDISTWLDAIQPDGAVKYLASWQGSKTTYTTNIRFGGFTPNQSYGQMNADLAIDFNISLTTVYKVRNPWDPIASLPTWDPYFKLTHLTDYAALVRQRIKSGV